MRLLLLSAFCCGLLTLLTIEGCARAHPAADPPLLKATDYVQLEYGGPKVQPQTIRIFANGGMIRDTTVVWSADFAVGCPLRPQDQEGSVAKEKAESLIYSANRAGFFKWDSNYNANSVVLDAGLTRITLKIGNDTHQVEVHAGKPPDAFLDIEEHVRSLAPIPQYAQYRTESQERQRFCQNLPRSAVLESHQKLFPPV